MDTLSRREPSSSHQVPFRSRRYPRSHRTCPLGSRRSRPSRTATHRVCPRGSCSSSVTVRQGDRSRRSWRARTPSSWRSERSVPSHPNVCSAKASSGGSITLDCFEPHPTAGSAVDCTPATDSAPGPRRPEPPRRRGRARLAIDRVRRTRPQSLPMVSRGASARSSGQRGTATTCHG